MRRWMFLLCWLCSIQVYAQTTGYKPVADLAAFRQTFARAAQQTQSIQADFVQEKNLSMLADKIVSKGKFWFKKENKVRMEYTQPSYYLMVMNGGNMLMKDKEGGRGASTRGNKLLGMINRITVDCIQGNVLNSTDFSAKVLENAGNYRLELTPAAKGLKQYFSAINLTVDKKDHSVTKIEMLEAGGDNTVISFLHKQLNVNIPDEVFAVK
jgi:outer membrane lipoprotein-sorting protein